MTDLEKTYRLALAQIADVYFTDLEESDDSDTILQFAQRRGAALEKIAGIIADLDETIFDDLDPLVGKNV